MWLLWACVGCPDDDGGDAKKSRHDPRYPEEPTDPGGPIVLEGVGTDGRLQFDLPTGSSEFVRMDLVVVPSGIEVELAIRGLVDTGNLEQAVATDEVVSWAVSSPDPYAGLPRVDERVGLDCAPLHRFTPDLSPLLAEAIARGATHASFVIEPIFGTLALQERKDITNSECPGTLAQRLEVYPTVRSTLLAKELTARVTDTSATLTLMSLLEGVEIEVDVAGRVIPAVAHSEEPVVIVLDGLAGDARTTYVVRVRKPGGPWEIGPERAVHTRRAPGKPFTFTVTSDGHFLNMEHRRAWASMVLLGSTMDRAASEQPDFHLDLGDTFFTESYKAWDAMDDDEAIRRHLEVRPYFERVGAPLYFVLGNHEGEQGWRFGSRDPIAARSELVRKMLFPNPDTQEPENYYAFRWGDVLIVVLDPYRFTARKPHDVGGDPGSGDRWDWTLGKDQADWLARTLAESDAPFELVFAHQLTGGTNEYGRGGRMAAEGLARSGSYEWGGKGERDGDDFAVRRPGWDKPIHQILADAGVVAFVRGHDHRFVWEPPLDGVAYVTVPQPGDATYGTGYNPPTHEDAVILPNAGHLLFASSPGKLEMSYVRSFLPEDGPDGEVAFTHTWTAD